MIEGIIPGYQLSKVLETYKKNSALNKQIANEKEIKEEDEKLVKEIQVDNNTKHIDILA